jgi:hypothetical protein
VDYVLVSSYGYRETMKAPEHDPRATAAYRSIFEQGQEVASFAPSDEVAGPELRLFSLHR